MGTIKILFCTIWDYPHVGGVSSHISSLVKGLFQLGHDCDIFSSSMVRNFPVIDHEAFVPSAEAAGSSYMMNYQYLLHLYKKVVGRLDLQRYDVIHAQDVITSALLRQVTDQPIALTVHGYLADEAISERAIDRNSREDRFLRAWERDGLQSADIIIAVDTAIQNYIQSEFPGDRPVLVSPNFVETDHFANLPGSDSPRKNLGIAEDKFVVLCPRRLVEKNGPLVGAMALPHLLSRVPNAHMIFLGSGPQALPIQQFIQQHGLTEHCELRGSVDSETMVKYLAACDAVLIPSVPSEGVVEATSIAALEAMASSKPVVASAIGGLAEIIVDGNTGLLVEPSNPLAIAEALARLAGDQALAHTLGNHARSYVQTRYSHVTAAKRFCQIYEALFRRM